MSAEPREFALLCPHCGEQNPPEFPVCWSCHGDLPAIVAEEPAAAPEESDSVDPIVTVPRRKRLAVELGVVLFLTWLPGIVWGNYYRRDTTVPFRFVMGEVSDSLNSIGILALLFYFLWLDGDWRRRLGLARPRLALEVLVVFATFASSWVAKVPVIYLFAYLGIEPSPGRGPEYESSAHWIAPISLLVSAFQEEALFRAYLWHRLTELTRQPLLSIAICALLFASGHGYPLDMTLVFFLSACIQGLLFWKVRSLWGLAIGHWLHNLWVVFA